MIACARVVSFRNDRASMHLRDVAALAATGASASSVARISSNVMREYSNGTKELSKYTHDGAITGRLVWRDGSIARASGIEARTVGHDRQKTVTHNETVHVGNDRTETVDRNEHITVHRHRAVRIDQNESLSVGAVRTVCVTGNDVEDYAGERQTTVHTADVLTVEDGPKTTTVHGFYDITVDDHFRVTRNTSTLLLDENLHGETHGTITLTANGNFVRIAPNGHVTVSAQEQLTLSCGRASIALMKDGTVSIAGPKEVRLASSESTVAVKPETIDIHAPTLNTSADGTHELSGGIVRVN
jgi:type VI secretion system secreted protein VgrG